jgi:hypothetical protein
MSNRNLALSLAALAGVSFLSTPAWSWGGSHSFAAAGVHGGSISHTGWAEGGYRGAVTGGSTSVTTPDGNTYSHSHVDGATTRPYGGSYYGYNGYSYPTYPVGGCYGSGFGAGLVTGAALANANAQNQSVNYDTNLQYNSNVNYSTPPSGVYQSPKPEY